MDGVRDNRVAPLPLCTGWNGDMVQMQYSPHMGDKRMDLPRHETSSARIEMVSKLSTVPDRFRSTSAARIDRGLTPIEAVRPEAESAPVRLGPTGWGYSG